MQISRKLFLMTLSVAIVTQYSACAVEDNLDKQGKKAQILEKKNNKKIK